MKIFTNKDSLREYSMSAYLHDERCNCELHRHEYFEIEFILSGSGTYEVDNIPYPMERDMLFFTTPSSFHFLNTDKPFRLINISFNFDIFTELGMDLFVDTTAPVALKLLGDEREIMHTYLRELIFAHREHNAPYEKCLLSCILQKIAKLSPEYTPIGNNHIRKALMYISGNLGNEITLESVATYLGISSVYLCTYFKDTMGMSFKSYLDNIRFDYAQKLLKSTEMSTIEIAHLSGFKDYSNFMRRFKKRFGITPNEFRCEQKEL